MEDLNRLYLEAVYIVFWQNAEIRFKIGEKSPEIDEILTHYDAQTFAFLTAHNPLSQVLDAEENNRRQSELLKLLNDENFQFLKGYGTNEDESWAREESLFILEISEEKVLDIARKLEQHAIVCGEKGGKPKLVWC